MSQIVVIRVVHEKGFVNLECLQRALEEINELDNVKIEHTTTNRYQLSISGQRRDGSTTENSLNLHLDQIVNQTVPIYARELAIQELTKQGFRIQNQRFIGKEYVLEFQREKSLKEGGEFERIIMTIHEDKTITLDSINFTGRACSKVTKPFETKIGKVVKRDLKEEYHQQTQQNTRQQSRQRERI